MAAAAAAITVRTAAIVPVHFHGYPMALEPLLRLARQHNLALVEDCAHAHGARRDDRHVGTFGNAGAFSFYPTKNLGCIGDGGAIVTDDDRLAEELRCLRSFESDASNLQRSAGVNSRLDTLQAAILRMLLPHLDERNRERVASAGQYRRWLAGANAGLPPDHPGAVYHQFALAVAERDQVRRDLKSRGVLTGTHYATPLNRYAAFASCAVGPLPATEALADRIVSLPIQPEVLQGHEEHVLEIVRECLSRERCL